MLSRTPLPLDREWMTANRRTRAVPELSAEQREELRRWVRRPRTARALARRARIVLACAEGDGDMAVAERLSTARVTVGKWRRRFPEAGCDGLLDEARPGAPRKIGDADVERVATMTLEAMPRDANRWSTRSMAAASGMSAATIGRIWRAFALKPHRVDAFKLSRAPLFIEKVRDIVGLYTHPPECAVALCVDGTLQIQALDRSQPLLPLRPGLPERRTHDDRRHGTASPFAALNAATGEVMGKRHRRHRSVAFRKFLRTIDRAVPADREVHLRCAAICHWRRNRSGQHRHQVQKLESLACTLCFQGCFAFSPGFRRRRQPRTHRALTPAGQCADTSERNGSRLRPRSAMLPT